MLKVYDGYDRVKRRARVRQLGSIALLPEVPREIPAELASKLTEQQQSQVMAKLSALYVRQIEDREAALPGTALSTVRALATAVQAGLTVEDAVAAQLRTAVSIILGGPPVRVPARATTSPIRGALESVNALIDAKMRGDAIELNDADELEIALDLAGEVLAELRGVSTTPAPTQVIR